MSTVDPAVERARRQERKKGGIGSLVSLLLAAVGCLVVGYLFGRGFAGISGTFRWMASQGINEMSSSEGPPYFWGVVVGSFGSFIMPAWYARASRTFTGGLGLPVGGLALTAAAATYGVWLQGTQWDGPTSGVMYGSGKPSASWFWDRADQGLPITFAVVTVLILAGGIWSFVRRNAKTERAQHVLDTGLRARAVVTEASWTGVEINGKKLIRFTVMFTDHAGVQRWVTKRATFGPVQMPSAGMPATVFYDPAHMDEKKIAVALEPLEAVEQKLYSAAEGPSVPGWTSPSQNADSLPPWGSSDGFYRGDTGHGFYRGDAGSGRGY